MPPVDLRDLVGDIRKALEDRPPEALIEILTYVFKEYVVEGPPPLATTPPALAEDLTGLSFAEVIQALQLRLDLPELALFQVQGDRVFLQHGGRPILIETQAARPEPLPPAPAAAPAAVSAIPAPVSPPASRAAALPAEPGRVSRGSASPMPAPIVAAAPRPIANPMSSGPAGAAARGPAAPGSATPSAPGPGPASPGAPPATTTERGAGRPAAPAAEETADSSGRFNLLEID